jgi:hypothetical protein
MKLRPIKLPIPLPNAIAIAPVVAAESLMPYEAVAKTIFVKANGLPAYYRAIGCFKYAR